MTIMKTVRKIHLWLSVPFGLIISVISLTGAALVFEPEITGLVRPGVELELHGPHNNRLPFFKTMFVMHRWLFDAPAVKGDMTVGKMVVALSTIAFAVALVTGLMLWLPRLRRKPLRSLTVDLRHGWFVFWRTLHVNGGAIVSLFLLLMALTGLLWSFPWLRTLLPDSPGVRPLTYALHIGSFGGWLVKTIWFVAALVGGILPLTGYYLWFKRLKRQSCTEVR